MSLIRVGVLDVGDPGVMTTSFEPFSPPGASNDFYIARLPFAEAQAILGALGGRPSFAEIGTVGFHGTAVDRDRGSFACVHLGGKFEDMLGQRVKITVAAAIPVVVYAFASTTAPVKQDITVTRRLFQVLAVLGQRQVTATVETVPRV